MASKKDAELLPEDTASDGQAFDASNLRVDFSEKEAASEGRSFEPLPTGKYITCITDWSLETCGPESKNPGKHYWHLELTIQDGKYEGRKVWTNVMLFSGALYSLAQLCKAMDREDVIQSGIVPNCDEFVSKPMVAIVKKQKDDYAMKRDGDGVLQFKNEVKGFMPLSAGTGDGAGSVTSGSGSLLPG